MDANEERARSDTAGETRPHVAQSHDAGLFGLQPKKKRPCKQPAEKRAKEPRETKQQRRHAAYVSRLVPPARPAETHFRHSHWRARREKVRNVLVSLNTNELVLNRWDECGSECSVEWNASEKRARLRANYCRCRHCEPCQKAKAGRMAANLRKRLGESKAGTVRFITLTLRHDDRPLADQLRHLYAAFKMLRKDPCWRSTQKGGAAILEVKHNGSHWHPHLHVLAEGVYLDQRRLSDAWADATGSTHPTGARSHVIDIRILSRHEDAAHYLTKYVTKGTSGDVWESIDLSQEWITATKGVRTANTFGCWRGFKLLAYESSNDGWLPLCPLWRLIEAAGNEEPWAVGILQGLRPPGQSLDVHPAIRKDAG
jgi:hypothetical protein